MPNVRLQPPPRSGATREPQATLAAVGCKAWLGVNSSSQLALGRIASSTMLGASRDSGGWASRTDPELTRSFFGIGTSRRRHLDTTQTGLLDGPLHHPGRLGLFDELADVGEPCGLALRNHHRWEVSPVAVL